MPDADKAKTTQTLSKAKNEPTRSVQLPIAAIIWFIATVLVFLVGTQTVTLQDRERFPDDFELSVVDANDGNTVQVEIVDGTFRYNVVPEVEMDVETGTYSDGAQNPIAGAIFTSVPDVSEVQIEAQTITISFETDVEMDLLLRRAQRPVTNILLNSAESISSEVVSTDDQQIAFTTTAESWRFGGYVPQLIPDGQEEVYETREAGESGSPLAQALFAEVNALEALTIRPGELLVTYRETANETQVVNRLTTALDDFHPRASLQADLWVITAGASGTTLVNISPFDTGIPLFIFTLVIALTELFLFYTFRGSDDKLIRPLLRVVEVFFFFWSIFGHEPIWDFLLSQLFPTSLQLVHPNATVIEFAAQHMELVIVSSLITIPAGLLIGILVTRQEFRELLPLINNLVNSGQTVPTIAVVAFMAPIIGFGFWPAIIALIAYGLLPVVRNTIAGLEAVDDFVVDSARGMGMTPLQILIQIELPIASSIIMAGIRTSMVINVGTATLGAFVGSGGLGTPITSGLSMTVDAFIVLGAIPAATLAILIDYVLGRIEYVITPRGLQIEA